MSVGDDVRVSASETVTLCLFIGRLCQTFKLIDLSLKLLLGAESAVAELQKEREKRCSSGRFVSVFFKQWAELH